MEILIAAIRHTPVFTLARDEEDFTVDIDASLHALEAVLSQYQDGELRIIAYASRTLDKAEKLLYN
jgi:hypothetical protein